MTRRELIIECSSALDREIEARKISGAALARLANVSDRAVQEYRSGRKLPSTVIWKILMDKLPLPDLISELSQFENKTNIRLITKRRERRNNVGADGLRDITPEERKEITLAVFGKLPREIPHYDDYSSWVLSKLLEIPVSEIRDHKLDCAKRLFREAAEQLTFNY